VFVDLSGSRNSAPLSGSVDMIASRSVVSGNTLCTAEGITVTLVKGSIVDQQVIIGLYMFHSK